MNKKNLTNVKVMLLSVLFFSVAFAGCENTELHNTNNYCAENAPLDFTTIDALNFTTLADGLLKVGGGVCISMGQQLITAKELFYNDQTQTVTINTEMNYTDGTQTIQAQKAKVNLDKENAEMSNVYYQLNNTRANGKAVELMTDKKTSQLTELTYSTCPKEDQQWYIKAQTAELDQESQVGVFRKMSLYFKGVPILYLPYAKMPLSDQRLSGFLIPEVGHSSTKGFDIALPYYINIAKNMDATLIPRFISKRGAMLGVEYRYLGENNTGEIYADYLPSDKLTNADRGFAELKYRHKLSQNWSLNSRLNNVSDKDYFEDFGSNINATSKSYIYSFLKINGHGENWKLSGRLNDYQIISDSITLNKQPYQTLPKLKYSWFNQDATNSIKYGIKSSWVNFYKEESITSTRFDITPYIKKTFQNNYSTFSPRLAYRQTNWDYSNVPANTNLKNNRSLPIVSLDYTINFEKQFTDGSFSSLEPRLFYLYAPFRDQKTIPLFDTHKLTFGSSLLYQTNAFSGADRQSDANQISVGITQRHFDSTGTEKWNFTLGQIAYFDDRKVQLNNSTKTRSTSPIITELNYLYRNWKATISVHWDTEIDKSKRALAKFQYKGKNNSLFNFAYRFRKGKIEQLDSSVVLPIGENNRFIARWNYSLDEHTTIEAIAGFEHKNCCWATRLVGKRYVFNEEGDVNNGIFFELQLNGLGSIGRNPRRLLKQSILGYSEEF